LNVFTYAEFLCSFLLGALLYTSCVLGLRPLRFINELTLLIKKKKINPLSASTFIHHQQICYWPCEEKAVYTYLFSICRGILGGFCKTKFAPSGHANKQ
jgi:hypothetical protein